MQNYVSGSSPACRTGRSTAGGETSVLAISSLVLAIISLLVSWLSIPAILCGHFALVRIKRGRGLVGGRKIALAGTVTGYLVLAALIVFSTLGSYVRESVARSAAKEQIFALSAALEMYRADNGI